jgi:hypothetical protein
MTIPALAVTKTLSKKQIARLEKLGATVTWGTVTATEAQMWLARIIGKTRVLLEKRGNMALSKNFP